VEDANMEFAQYERLKRYELLAREWTIDHGEMTPKLSLKRKVILGQNRVVYEKIYRDSSTI
jgi:long-chain acyl-CoA synthetase